jgi:hypothetical protein
LSIKTQAWPRHDINLSPEHYPYLTSCGLSDEVISTRSYLTLNDERRDQLVERYGMHREQVAVEGILIPRQHPTKEQALPQIRLDVPRVDNNGRTRRYDSPVGSGGVVDVHPLIADEINDTTRPIWTAESIKCSDSLVSRGLLAVGIAGCAGGFQEGSLSPDWSALSLYNREVRLAIDSDCQFRHRSGPSDPRAMLIKLGHLLARDHGAVVRVALIPHAEDGSKRGIDDYMSLRGV